MSAVDLCEMVSAVLANVKDHDTAARLIRAIVARNYGSMGGRPRKNLLQPVCEGGTISVSESDSESDSDPDQISEQNTPPSETGSNRFSEAEEVTEVHTPPYSAGFLAFWASYPKHVGKGAAWASWRKLRPSVPVVLKALEWQTRQPQWGKDGGAYIPLPTTWLNQHRWEDDPPTASGPQYRMLVAK